MCFFPDVTFDTNTRRLVIEKTFDTGTRVNSVAQSGVTILAFQVFGVCRVGSDSLSQRYAIIDSDFVVGVKIRQIIASCTIF